MLLQYASKTHIFERKFDYAYQKFKCDEMVPAILLLGIFFTFICMYSGWSL